MKVELGPIYAVYDPSNGYIYIANYYSSSVSVIEEISNHSLGYSVTFVESGLPPGTTWSVTLNGVTKSSTSNSITFILPEGTYSYSVITPSGYSIYISSGIINVNRNMTLTLYFTPISTSTSSTTTTTGSTTTSSSAASSTSSNVMSSSVLPPPSSSVSSSSSVLNPLSLLIILVIAIVILAVVIIVLRK